MDTAVREVREETGLDVEVTGLLGIWLDQYHIAAKAYVDPDVRPPDHTMHIYYHAVPTGRVEPRPDPEEVLEVAWFAPDDPPRRLAFPRRMGAVIDTWRRQAKSGGLPMRYELPDR